MQCILFECIFSIFRKAPLISAVCQMQQKTDIDVKVLTWKDTRPTVTKFNLLRAIHDF